jgi:hypothetical protein
MMFHLNIRNNKYKKTNLKNNPNFIINGKFKSGRMILILTNELLDTVLSSIFNNKIYP